MIPAEKRDSTRSMKTNEHLHLGTVCTLEFVPWGSPLKIPLETKLLHIIFWQIKSCKGTALHYSNWFSHSTERKNCNCNRKIFVVSKEEQHCSLHYKKEFPPGILCCKVSYNNYWKWFDSGKAKRQKSLRHVMINFDKFMPLVTFHRVAHVIEVQSRGINCHNTLRQPYD